jgi:hypothetical protein
MRKIIATIAALGFLGTTSLTPVLAAASIDGTAPSDDLSAAKKKAKKKVHKKKAKKVMEKKATDVGATDLSAAKKKKRLLRRQRRRPSC